MKISLHKNSLKLAGIYLAILMFISLLFSANVYKISNDEFVHALHRPQGRPAILNELPGSIEQEFREELQQSREDQYTESHDKLVNRLIIINIAILIGGGALSYYFALRTLRPIEEAHDAQARFTADASHELRTPLTAMRTETEVALLDPKLTTKKARGIFESNVEELDRLTTLTEGLLLLARGEHTQITAERLLLSPIVQTAVDKIMPLAEKKRILITYNIPDNIAVQGEAASLTEAVVILLDNAVKYSPEKSEVSVTAINGKHVSLSVTDKGIGIKADEIPHIFERFYRADSARSKQAKGGYGLGLAIAKNIIDKHHGAITVSSKPKEGTTFTATLPRA